MTSADKVRFTVSAAAAGQARPEPPSRSPAVRPVRSPLYVCTPAPAILNSDGFLELLFWSGTVVDCGHTTYVEHQE
jgi:hypothetical protein